MMTVGLHCPCIGKPARFAALKRFVEYVAGKEGGVGGDEDADRGAF